VTDVGHAGAEEHVVDLGAGDLGEELDVVRIIRAGQDRLGDLLEIDLDDRRVLGVLVGPEQLGFFSHFCTSLMRFFGGCSCPGSPPAIIFSISATLERR
jgi:hypothetical protein